MEVFLSRERHSLGVNGTGPSAGLHLSWSKPPERGPGPSTSPRLVHPRRRPHEAVPPAFATSAQEADSCPQGELPCPLVRREPKTASAVNADIVGRLPSFILGRA